MPQVPYQPIENVGPRGQDTPSLADRVPEAAFGGNVAQAVEGLGKTIEQSSGQIFQEAIRLQSLNNETAAKNANIDFMLKAGDLHAKYNALQGQDQVAAYPEYSRNLQKLYQDTRGELGNDMARRMFDSSAVSVMSRSIFNAAGSAATAQREAHHTALEAEQDLNNKQVYTDPNDEASFRTAIDSNHQTAADRARGMVGGYSPEREQLLIKNGDSTLAFNRIVGMARDHSDQAYKLLAQYEKEGLIYGPQDIQARNKVESYISTKGMDNITNSILNKYLQPDGTYGESSTEMQAEAEKTAKGLYPDIAGIDSAARQALDRNYNQHTWAQTRDQQMRKQQVDNFIVKGVTDTSMLPPELVHQMTPAEIKAFPGQANTYQRSIQTATDRDAYHDYLGLYNNDNAKFMDTNFMQVPGLSQGLRKTFISMQREAKADGDPRVWKAMKQLQGSSGTTLDALGVTGPSKDRDTANQFVGALHDAIQSYQETNGKAPDEKTIQEQIFPTVTRQVTQKGYLWNSQTPFFSAAVPDEYKEKFLAAQPGATDEAVGRAYRQQMFEQFFKSQKASKDQSRAP